MRITASRIMVGLFALFLILSSVAISSATPVAPQVGIEREKDCSSYDERIKELQRDYATISDEENAAYEAWRAVRDPIFESDLPPFEKVARAAPLDEAYFEGRWARLDQQKEILKQIDGLRESQTECLTRAEEDVGDEEVPLDSEQGREVATPGDPSVRESTTTAENNPPAVADGPREQQPPAGPAPSAQSGINALELFDALLTAIILPIGEAITATVVGVGYVLTGKFFTDLATLIQTAWNAGATPFESGKNVAGRLWALIDPFAPIVEGVTKGLPQMVEGFQRNDMGDVAKGGATFMGGFYTAIGLGIAAAGSAMALRGRLAKSPSTAPVAKTAAETTIETSQRILDEVSSIGQVAHNAQTGAEAIDTQLTATNEVTPTPEKPTLRARIVERVKADFVSRDGNLHPPTEGGSVESVGDQESVPPKGN